MDTNKWFYDKIAPCRMFAHSIQEEIYTGKTEFQQVRIFKSLAFGKMLTLDCDLQSAEFDEYIYHETLVHPAMMCHPQPQKVLILGGGEGAVLREVVKYKCLKNVVMVDLDKELVEICREYLPEWSKNSFLDKRLIQVFTDAREYLLNSKEKFDVIISDLVEPLPDSPARFLLTKEFYELIKSRLSDKGIFIMQASMAGPRDNFLHSIIYRTLSSVFLTVRSAGVFIPSYCNRWGFILASDECDPLLLNREKLEITIKDGIEGEISFYDYEAYRSIFAPGKPLRLALERQTSIFTNDDTSLLANPHRFL